MTYLKKLIKHIKDKGFLATLFLVSRVLFQKFNIVRILNSKKSSAEIDLFLNKIKDKKVIIFYHVSGWGGALKQRPHHIATELSKRGSEYIYPQESFFNIGNTPVKTNEQGVHVVSSLTPFLKFEAYKKKPTLHLWSTNYMLTVDFLERYQNKFNFFYEFVDEIDASITGTVSSKYLDAHKWLLKNKSVPVVCTAQKLIEEARETRGEDTKIYMASNGVFVEDFDVNKGDLAETAPSFKTLAQSGKKILGYYGALASWVDFDLLKHIATSLPDVEVVLIGNDYDGSLKRSNIEEFSNVHVLPPVNYYELKSYGKFFDVGLIPFKVNEVTESTSPVKLFEYMAMKLPTVSTNIRECRAYESVLIGKDHEGVILKIKEALNKKNNDEYLKTLETEAFLNSWEKKTDVVEEALRGF